tara:strand:+ start:8181 stop:8777 length:597 start_codon:yes stop_codon:yes gene_type:complete
LVFQSVDQIGRRYGELGGTLVSVRGIDLVAARGEVCVFCGGPQTRIKRGKVNSPGRWYWETICAVCREPWEGEYYEVLRRWVQEGSTTNGVESEIVNRIDEWRTVRPLVEVPARRDARGLTFPRGRWRFCVTAWLLYVQPRFSSYEEVADYGGEHHADLGDIWTEKRVRSGVSKARGVIQKRGQVAGVLRLEAEDARF